MKLFFPEYLLQSDKKMQILAHSLNLILKGYCFSLPRFL